MTALRKRFSCYSPYTNSSCWNQKPFFESVNPRKLIKKPRVPNHWPGAATAWNPCCWGCGRGDGAPRRTLPRAGRRTSTAACFRPNSTWPDRSAGSSLPPTSERDFPHFESCGARLNALGAPPANVGERDVLSVQTGKIDQVLPQPTSMSYFYWV